MNQIKVKKSALSHYKSGFILLNVILSFSIKHFKFLLFAFIYFFFLSLCGSFCFTVTRMFVDLTATRDMPKRYPPKNRYSSFLVTVCAAGRCNCSDSSAQSCFNLVSCCVDDLCNLVCVFSFSHDPYQRFST